MKHFFTLLFISSPLFFYVNKGTEAYANRDVHNMYWSPLKMIEEGQAHLQEGDLVVRLSRDPVSGYIKQFNRQDKKYSHSGIVIFEQGQPYVYHIVNGQENPDEKLRRDSLSRFCDPKYEKAYGIFRYDMSKSEILKLKTYVQTLYVRGVRFDNDFNFATNERMYCSEMISKALTESTAKRIFVEPVALSTVEALCISAHTHLPLSYTSHMSIVPIDALYENPFCHLVREYRF